MIAMQNLFKTSRVLLLYVACVCFDRATPADAAGGQAEPWPHPSHTRPYFLPESRRQEILKQVQEAFWAKEVHASTVAAAEKSDADWAGHPGGFWAAFLYALEGDPKHLAIAEKWLLKGWGLQAGETIRKKKLLDTPANWQGPENSVDWYLLDIDGYVAFDWVYRGLSAEARQNIHEGLAIQTRYRMACMDSWGSTPNLNFKPISMIALGALALQDEDIMRWAFQRTRRQGSYRSMLDRMLRGGGPWHEAPIYAIAHKSLWCMTTVAFYGQLYDGRGWFGDKLPSGGSPKGLMDYYVETSYPIERSAGGSEGIRIATFGDGSTGIKGGTSDHFLSNLFDELALAYAITGDARYAAFLKMQQNYQPNLWDRRPLPTSEARYPAAPSMIWPVFGVAMLRSDESPGYWTNPNALAALQVMTQGYGHDHYDKFGLTLFGANRLLYPDYLGLQYELLAMGWANTPVCHNTMMVDDQDTANAPPHVRSDFTPDVKFLATSATGVFEGVAQTRALFLAREYLLDLFAASSKVPHTYDYILNCLGLPQTVQPTDLPAAPVLSPRYWALEETRTGFKSDAWSMDFLIKEPQHEAKVRVTMAADRETQVCSGTWGPGKFAERALLIHGERDLRDRWGRPPWSPQKLGMLVARRDGRRSTVFAATHEPYANSSDPKIRSVTRVAETEQAMVVRVEGEGFTDYAAVAWGDDVGSPVRVLAASNDSRQVFAFRNYGYLRLTSTGAVARGGWSGLHIPHPLASGRLLLDGRKQRAQVQDGFLTWGELGPPQLVDADPECPFPVTPFPPLTRLSAAAETCIHIRLTNTLDEPVTGNLEFDLPPGITLREDARFGPVAAGDAVSVPVRFATAREVRSGRRTIPFRLRYRAGTAATEVRTQYLPLPAVVWTSVRADRTHGEIVVETAGYTVRMNSQSQATTYLADPDGTVRLERTPLFTFGDEQGRQVLPVHPTGHAWLNAASVTTGAGLFAQYTTEFRPDRMELPYASKAYTRMTEAHFTIPGDWLSPAGPPRWKWIIALDEQGQEFEAQPGQGAKIVAAELEFPQAAWNLALQFNPPRPVRFVGLEVQFMIPIRESETWSLGFCKPGTLDDWRRRKAVR
jgi:hypothetical protein